MNDAEEIFAMLGNANVEEPQEELQEDSPLPLGIFLRLVERTLNEARQDNKHVAKHQAGKYINNFSSTWHDPDDANSNNGRISDEIDKTVAEQEDLEETSGVPAVQGFSGTKQNEEESLIREEEDGLVEEVMNYLLNKTGVTINAD